MAVDAETNQDERIIRGDIVHRIYGVHTGREKDTYFGTFRTHAEAEAEIVRLSTREMHGSNWARQYHDRGWETAR